MPDTILNINETSEGSSAPGDLQKKIEVVERLVEQSRQDLEALKTDKISFITVSGIFLSVFTFISVEIQFLKYICDFYQVLGFTLILASLMLLFVIAINYVASSWVREENPTLLAQGNIVIFLCVIFFLLGIMFIKNTKFGACQNTPNSSIQIINQK